MLKLRVTLLALVTALLYGPLNREASAAPFNPGDFVTYVQDDWGDHSTTAGALLDSRFNGLYGGVGYLQVGILGSPGLYAMLFTSASAMFTYLPGSGAPGPLKATLVDPTVTPAGIFAGEVVALRLNVDFSDGGLLVSLGTAFGNLTIHDYAGFDANGLTVRQFLGQADVALGGGLPSYDFAAATDLVKMLNGSFAVEGGVPSPFAQDHLRIPVVPVPEPMTLSLTAAGFAALAARRKRRV